MFEWWDSLDTFFPRMFPAAQKAGYKLIVTLLAREADCSVIFRDIERYWSSLHNVTGEDILFVFGANHAGDTFESGMIERLPKGLHRCLGAAIRGKRELDWPPDNSRLLEQQLRLGHDHASQEITSSHSMEITELRLSLGLSEKMVPALVVFLPEPEAIRTKLVLSLSELEPTTIYLLLKKLVELLEEQMYAIRRLTVKLCKLRRQLVQLDASESKLQWSSLKDSGLLNGLPPTVQKTALAIETLCQSSVTDESNKRTCFELLQSIKKELGGNRSLTIELQSLIDRSFSNRRSELLEQVRNAEQEVTLIWREVKLGLAKAPQKADVKSDSESVGWDCFIAHSSSDVRYAVELFQELAKHVRAYLDSIYLQPGDNWYQILRAEQDRAKCTVILITEQTEKAWYQTSEILHAIELNRNGHHRIIPILIGKNIAPPYGLEQVHYLQYDEKCDFGAIAGRIAEALRHDHSCKAL